MKKAKRTKTWTVIIRKGSTEYVGICLELNVAARGHDIPDVQRNLKNAIRDYLDCLKHERDIQVQAIPTEELIEFLQDTQPAFLRSRRRAGGMLPLEVNEVPLYV